MDTRTRELDPVDRRTQVRHHLRLRMCCKSLDVADWVHWKGECRDLCTHGILLSIERNFQPQTVLMIELESPFPLPVGSLLARVRWTAKNDSGGWFLGCALVQSLQEDEIGSIIGESTRPLIVAVPKDEQPGDRRPASVQSRGLSSRRLDTSESATSDSLDRLRNRVGKKTMEIRLPSRRLGSDGLAGPLGQPGTAPAAEGPRSTAGGPIRPAARLVTPRDTTARPAPVAPKDPPQRADRPTDPAAGETCVEQTPERAEPDRASQELRARLTEQIQLDDLPAARKTLLALLERNPGDAESLGMLAYIHDVQDSTGQAGELRCFAGHRSPVNSVTFAADGQHVFSGSGGEYQDGFYTDGVDRTLRVWDTMTGSEVARFKEQMSPVLSIARSPGGSHLVMASRNGNLYYIDARDVSIFRTLASHHQMVFGVTFSADGKHILTGSDDGVVRLWDLMGKRLRRFAGHSSAVTSVAFSADASRVLSGSLDGTVRLWDTETGSAIRCFEGHAKAVLGVAFAPGGLQVLSGSADATLRLWEVEAGTEPRCFQGHTEGVTSVAFTADGLRILSGSGDKTVRLWDRATGAELHCFTGHTAAVKCLALSPGGRRALSGGADRTVRLWRLPT